MMYFNILRSTRALWLSPYYSQSFPGDDSVWVPIFSADGFSKVFPAVSLSGGCALQVFDCELAAPEPWAKTEFLSFTFRLYLWIVFAISLEHSNCNNDSTQRLWKTGFRNFVWKSKNIYTLSLNNEVYIQTQVDYLGSLPHFFLQSRDL